MVKIESERMSTQTSDSVYWVIFCAAQQAVRMTNFLADTLLPFSTCPIQQLTCQWSRNNDR